MTEPTVFVVDDDDAVRNALQILIESMGIRVAGFSSVQAFLDGYDPNRPGCLVLDVRLPRMSGLELQEHLRRQGIHIPVIFISGHGNVAMAVRTMKAGAVDFLEKPFDDQILLESIQRAIEQDRQAREDDRWHEQIKERLNQLSRREEEVLHLLIRGMSNKVIAHEMNLSTKTVETHRAHIMRKLGVNSMAGLMWIALSSGEYQDVPDQLPFPPRPATHPPMNLSAG
jgi:RNA polymerase sigma factor (sigma-70 family)